MYSRGLPLISFFFKLRRLVLSAEIDDGVNQKKQYLPRGTRSDIRSAATNQPPLAVKRFDNYSYLPTTFSDAVVA